MLESILIVAMLVLAVAALTASPLMRKILRGLAWLIGCGGWAGWVMMMLYWHLRVEPRLDGSEGVGASFGWFIVHFGIPVVAVILSVYAATLFYLLKVNRWARL